MIKLTAIALSLGAVLASGQLAAANVEAAAGDIESGLGYVTVGGNVLKTGLNECAHSGTFAADAAIGACEGGEADTTAADAADKAEPAPAPKAAPVQQAKIVTGEIDGTALFATNSDTLSAEGSAAIDALIAQVAEYKGVTAIEVIGHTDSRGADEYNQALSERRAAAVAAMLKAEYPDANITSTGMGETSPIATNDTEEGRAQNRRVEVNITAHRMTFE